MRFEIPALRNAATVVVAKNRPIVNDSLFPSLPITPQSFIRLLIQLGYFHFRFQSARVYFHVYAHVDVIFAFTQSFFIGFFLTLLFFFFFYSSVIFTMIFSSSSLAATRDAFIFSEATYVHVIRYYFSSDSFAMHLSLKTLLSEFLYFILNMYAPPHTHRDTHKHICTLIRTDIYFWENI